MTDKQQKQLIKLLESTQGAAVQPDELMQVVEAIIRIITEVKESIDEQTIENKVNSKEAIAKLEESLSELESYTKDLVTSSDTKNLNNLKDTAKELLREIKKVENKILPPQDLSGIKERIEILEDGVEVLSSNKPDEGKDIVDKINKLDTTSSLQIDASHIKNLPEIVKNSAITIGGSRPVSVLNNGTYVAGAVTEFNFVNPTSITTTGKAQRRVNITTGSGGSGTPGGSDTQVQFNDGGSFGGDTAFTWNKTTNSLTVGLENSTGSILTPTATTADTTGGSLDIISGDGNSLGDGGALSIASGVGGDTGSGGNISITSGASGGTSGNGGFFLVEAGSGTGATFTGGNIQLKPGAGLSGATDGYLYITDPTSAISAKFNTTSLATSDKTFTFPNTSGTFALTSDVTVSKVGTPADNQVAVWTGDGTIEGDTALTFNTSTDTLTVGSGAGIVTTHSLKSDHSDGVLIEANNGTDIGILGVGNTANVTWYGNHNFGGNINLQENTSIALDPAGSADGKYSGITVTGTGGATIAFGDLVTLDKDDSRWELVDISVAAAATGDARGIIGIAVTSSTDGGSITVLLNGIIRADAAFPVLTIGAAVYASTTGDVVVTQPTTTDHVIRVVGYGLTADEMYFNPENDWITHT